MLQCVHVPTHAALHVQEIDAPGVDPAAGQLPAQAPSLAPAPAPVVAAPQSTARCAVLHISM